MKILRGLCLIVGIISTQSCFLLTKHNFSNDHLFRKELLSSPLKITYEYAPKVQLKVEHQGEVYFLKNKDSLGGRVINQLIIEKLSKKRIIVVDNEQIKLKIEEIVIRENKERTSVSTVNGDNEIEYIGEEDKIKLSFLISASIFNSDKFIAEVKYEDFHETDPRESFLITGYIVSDGESVDTNRIISNCLNRFCSMVYYEMKKINEARNK